MRQRGVAPDAVNENPESIAIYGPQGPKMNASFYIDDKAFGIKKTALGGVDWKYIKRNYKNYLTVKILLTIHSLRGINNT